MDIASVFYPMCKLHVFFQMTNVQIYSERPKYISTIYLEGESASLKISMKSIYVHDF